MSSRLGGVVEMAAMPGLPTSTNGDQATGAIGASSFSASYLMMEGDTCGATVIGLATANNRV